MDAEIISVLNAQYKERPAQAKNLDAMINHIKDGKPLPNATKSILYAIDGKAGVANAAEYGNMIKETGATLSPEVHEKEHKPLTFFFASNCPGTFFVSPASWYQRHFANSTR